MDPIAPDTPVATAAAVILGAKAEPLFALEARVASGEDMDAVHDMRVASRRLRAALAIFRRHYPQSEWKRWNRAARTVTRALGAVRDADVFVDEFSALASRATDPAERLALAFIVGHRLGQRSRDLDAMRGQLGHLRLAQRRDSYLEFVASADPAADMPLSELAEEIVSERLDALFSHLPEALEPEAASTQHAMRISVKRLRYAIETLRPCFSARAGRVIDTLKRFQDALGELHDTDVFSDAVRAVVVSGESFRAGVPAEGLEAVLGDLAAEREARFAAFASLTATWPEERLRAEVLGMSEDPA